MYKFEKLRVWQQAMDLAVKIYKFTEQLPKEETYGLRGQLRRASVSISLNIAEGTGDKSDKELVRYLYLAKKSLFETVAGLKITERIYGLSPEQILENCDRLGRSLQALINSLSKSND